MVPSERRDLIERYARGPHVLRTALERVPPEASKWRPAPGKWSVHEIVCHCADSETIASTRIRYLGALASPTIQGYDQDRFAEVFRYHELSLDMALRQIDKVRAWTTDLIRRFTDEQWARTGTHTESGAYGAEIWLGNYAAHLESHARQIERNVAAWNAGRAAPSASTGRGKT